MSLQGPNRLWPVLVMLVVILASALLLEAFARRVDLRQVGKRALECLIKVGALDSFGARLDLLESLDRIHSFSVGHFRAKEVGQLSLFGKATGVSERLELIPASIEISKRRQLSWERELLGTYISDHPLASRMDDPNTWITTHTHTSFSSSSL